MEEVYTYVSTLKMIASDFTSKFIESGMTSIWMSPFLQPRLRFMGQNVIVYLSIKQPIVWSVCCGWLLTLGLHFQISVGLPSVYLVSTGYSLPWSLWILIWAPPCLVPNTKHIKHGSKVHRKTCARWERKNMSNFQDSQINTDAV